jgi:thioredoxin reductase
MNKTVAILGGGPAGLTCALWLKQLGLTPVVLERLPQAGGIQRTSHYVNGYYLGLAGNTGREVAEQFVRHATAAELTVRLAARIESIAPAGNGFAVRTDETVIEAEALVVATGQRVRGPEAVPAIQADWDALRGQARFDPGETPRLADQVLGRVVAVVGGGDNAMSTAVMLGQSAAHVHLLSRSALHGFQINREAVRGLAAAGRLTWHHPAEIRSLERAEERLRFGFAASGGPCQNHLADYVCFRLGFVPNTEAVNLWLAAGGLPPLTLTPGGHIVTDQFQRTSAPRIYAAGDVTNVRDACVAAAVAQGAIAARSVEEDLQKDGVSTSPRSWD